MSYTGSGSVISEAKGKVSLSLSGWKDGIKKGTIRELLYSKKLGTSPIKDYATAFVRGLGTDVVKLVPVPEQTFVKFLTTEGAKDNCWTMRFWEVNYAGEESRAITAGRETPNIWTNIVKTMIDLKRRTNWAGVEFTHPELQTRVLIHRWPTAAISPWGQGGEAYTEVKNRFVKIL